MIEEFKAFLEDSSAWDMFVTGRAGTGKTTKLAELTNYLDAKDYDFRVCAFTHKACGILMSKLPCVEKIQTLHSFIKKRPTINPDAKKLKHIENNAVMGKADVVQLLFIDEYSMIGEQDLMDIRALQDEDYDGKPSLKIVWLGDPYQLPPVGDMFTLKPYGDYQVTLTKIYRQGKDNPLSNTLESLVSFIEGSPPTPLPESDSFVRGQNLVELFIADKSNKVLLAYTNQRVQELNQAIQGRISFEPNDAIFSPTSKQYYMFDCDETKPDCIKLPFGTEYLHLDSKYKTLEHLHTLDYVYYASVLDLEDGGNYTLAYVYGHADYLNMLKVLKQDAAQANYDIENEFNNVRAAGWARNNPTHPLARARAKAWRDYLTFNDCVLCLDFAHAQTVHKSQGSTYETVYLDTKDIGKCADRNYELYLKLMYVGCSRASKKVITN